MNEFLGKIQVNHDHYFNKQYLDKSRFMGLFAQYFSINQVGNFEKLLEIGPGPGLFSSLMRYFDRDITTVDFDRYLKPNLVAIFPNLPIKRKSFDIVCAFEVLEHLPFSLLSQCLKEMARISKSHVLLSVPNINYLNPKIKISAEIILGKLKFNKNFQKSIHKDLCNIHEHYWEIGFNGYTIQKVVKIAEESGLILQNTKFFEPWFQFFTFKS